MTGQTVKTSNLGITTTLSANDRVVVLTNPASSAQTQTIAANNLASSIVGLIPYANASNAGVFKVGAGLSINVNGVLSAPVSPATANSLGVVQPDNSTITINAGVISANINGYQTTAGLNANVAAYLPTYGGIVNASSHTVGSAFIANSTQLTFTPNTFNLGSVSKAANGYVWLPNGVLYQWGTVLANTTSGNATFAIPFPTACQSVTLSVIGSTNVAYQSATPNTTVATIRTGSTTTAISVQYKAIGY